MIRSSGIVNRSARGLSVLMMSGALIVPDFVPGGTVTMTRYCLNFAAEAFEIAAIGSMRTSIPAGLLKTSNLVVSWSRTDRIADSSAPSFARDPMVGNRRSIHADRADEPAGENNLHLGPLGMIGFENQFLAKKADSTTGLDLDVQPLSFGHSQGFRFLFAEVFNDGVDQAGTGVGGDLDREIGLVGRLERPVGRRPFGVGNVGTHVSPENPRAST